MAPEQTSARRRLVRGAFAAPVALTLHSGSAFAAVSASCVARQVANPVISAADTATGTWLKVQVWRLDPPGNDNNSRWVEGKEILNFAKTNSNFISDGEWLCITRNSTSSKVIVGGTEQTAVKGNKYAVTLPAAWGNAVQTGLPTSAVKLGTTTVAIRVNAQGDIVGVVDVGNEANSSAVTGSCWSSFRP